MDVQKRMHKLISDLYFLNRATVSKDSDKVVEYISKLINCEVISVPSGSECLTWIIPEEWNVKEAYIETLSGKRIVDFKNSPLHLFAYSAPFKGVISLKELKEHLLYDKSQPDAIVYHYRNQYRYGNKKEWGFSIPYNLYKTLNEEKYRVVVDTEFKKGGMKIIDYRLKGRLEDTIFVCAHTCHPAQVNDGISAAAVGIELFKYLEELKNRKYSYRLILGPEYFAAAGFLANARDVDKLKYGIYLDMLGTGGALGFSRSFIGSTYIDKAIKNVLRHKLKSHIDVPYRQLYGNDEMFYDGPFFNIPMICLARKDSAERPLHHHDTDNLENCDFNQLKEALNILKNLVDIFEKDFIPVKKYRGPLYLSRYNLYIDPEKDVEGYFSLQAIQILMDQKKSCLEIASELNIDLEFVYKFATELVKNGLATKHHITRS